MVQIDRYLVINLPAVMSKELLRSYGDKIARMAGDNSYRGIILNLDAVTMLDLTSLEQIRSISKSNRLLGAKTVLTGARPSIALYLSGIIDKLDGLIFCKDIASARLACG